MKDAVNQGVFPGGVLLVSRENNILFHQAFGHTDSNKDKPVTTQTLYDLASLTKPLATTMAVMKLVENLQVNLDDRLDRFLDISKDTDKAGITIRHLLMHSSGLPDYCPYFKIHSQTSSSEWRTMLLKWIVREPLVQPPGETNCYSDLGFMLLRGVIETVTGSRLDQWVQTEIYQPIQLMDLCFLPLEQSYAAERIAPTENCTWRGVLVQGHVHDENAYAAGGVDGQAGLFGTATAIHCLLLKLFDCYVGQSALKMFPQSLIRAFFDCGTETERPLGFDRPATQKSAAGRLFSKSSVGHLGFTGTSFWMDLARSIIVVLLSNRIHPTRDNERIKDFRPMIHDEIMSVLGFS